MGRTSSIAMLSLVGLGLRKPPGEQKVRCFLSVTLLKERVCEYHITMTELELRNKFGTVG